MGFYAERILPRLLDKACANPQLMALRRQLVPQASGRVLEVGMGSAINAALYDPDKVVKVWGLEPSAGMRRRAQKNLAKAPVSVDWLDLPGEAIPLEDNSVDTLLLTFTLCTIPDWQRALQQMHRVLKPGARLLFCEHGRAPDSGVARWQNRINPLWRRVAGGCNLNRPIVECLESEGFVVGAHSSRYVEELPKIAGYVSMGEARADK